MLNPDEFSVVYQGGSPLYYGRFGAAQRSRFGLVHPELAAQDEVREPLRRLGNNARNIAETEYYAPQVLVGRGLNDRKLKTPKLVNNPSAAVPGTGGFVDFLDMERGAPPEEQGEVYVDYVNRRSNLQGLGAANRLIRSVAESRPNARINLGRVMSPRVWKVGEELAEEGRDVEMRRDF